MIARLLSLSGGSVFRQVLQLSNALLVLKTLEMHEFGVYVPATALCFLASAIATRGLDGAIVSLSSGIYAQGPFGRLLRGSFYLSNALLIISIPLCLFSYFIFYRPTLDALDKFYLVALISITPLFISRCKIAEAYFILREKVGALMIAHCVSEVIRASILVSSLVFDLSLAGVVLAFFLQYFSLYLFFKFSNVFSSPDLIDRDRSSIASLRRVTDPLIPGVIFSTIQDNILIFIAMLISDVSSVATIAVANRFVFFFSFLSPISNYFLLPRFSASMDLRRSFGVLGKSFLAFSLILFLISFSVFKCYPFIIAFLGDEYQAIEPLLLSILCLHSLKVISSLFWSFQVARKWIWPWMPIFSIPFTLLVQSVGVYVFDVSTLEGALNFGLLTVLTSIVIRLVMFTAGSVAYKSDTGKDNA